MTNNNNSENVQREDLQIGAQLARFIEDEALAGLDVSKEQFWAGFSELVNQFTSKNHELLQKRENIQNQIDEWHIEHRNQAFDKVAYKSFLEEIGYLVPEGEPFQIQTQNVDPEIASIPGPQLVVPVTNARFILNAANARWGSFYDCLYGTDAMGLPLPSGKFDTGRGARVIARASVFLDKFFALTDTSHDRIKQYKVEGGALYADGSTLKIPEKFVGYRGSAENPSSILLCNNGLHVELVFDDQSTIGKMTPSSLSDIRLESAVSAIIDFEDSVACVDAEDKVLAYRNWLGLMKGDLVETFEKSGKSVTRKLSSDRAFTTPSGADLTLKGRALLLVRNVGHLMTNPAMIDGKNAEVFEGLMDAMITTLIAMHDLKKTSGDRNSHHGSIYVVKPKMHGPEEVAFADEIFTKVEQILGLPQYTVKLGIMDEERRTSVNLKECIRAAKHRVCFINTGFLDRTGDEIHTSMEAGAFSRKDFIKRKSWITAYENQNVDIGLECGFSGKAQIGKGMWAVPDNMAAMLEQKIEHPRAGANCAWVPSPTAATLHATHYHEIDVFSVQKQIQAGGRRAYVEALLDIPLASYKRWSAEQIRREAENNAQGILGYVVRWIDQGIGCSKVPDINDVGLMEDRATCRISAQHLANWIYHEILSEEDANEILQAMAVIVDRQNSGDANYKPMSPDFDGYAFRAARALVLQGRQQPSGYTEPLLHKYRLELKANQV